MSENDEILEYRLVTNMFNEPNNDYNLHTKPIISYGLIVFNLESKKWVVTQRKHSVEFLIYISGDYRDVYLPFLLKNITIEESRIIEKILKSEIEFKILYFVDLSLDQKNFKNAYNKLLQTRTIVEKLLIMFIPDTIIKNDLCWVWPKGRLSSNIFRENPLECAKREFYEEVGFTLSEPVYISDNYISEIFITISGKVIESRFWIYIIECETPIPKIEKYHPEVSNRKWATSEEVLVLMKKSKLFEEVCKIMNSKFINN